jgi:hypothetical protein
MTFAERSQLMFSRLRVLASRFRGFFAGHRLDEDFQHELASHLDMLTEENIRRGAVSLIACVVPALQAASTDPSQVLRE